MSKRDNAPSSKAEPTSFLRAPARGLSSARRGLIQRQCSCKGGSTGCQTCAERKRQLLRAARTEARSGPATAPPIVDEVLSSPGHPLDTNARAFMEPRFGQDFGHVRVHTDARAAESAQQVQALAYTVGHHIVFDQGQYQPHTTQGRHLLAHELTHTVQQQGQGASSAQTLTFDSPGHGALEQEAEATASTIVSMPETESVAPPAVRSRPAMATLSRQRNWRNLAEPLRTEMDGQAVVASEKGPSQEGSAAPTSMAFLVNVLHLPAAKAPFIDRYEAMVEKPPAKGEGKGEGGLQAVLSLSDTATSLKQKRDATKPLQNSWLASLKANEESIKEAWKDISGSPFPQARGETCEMDHIVELQLGGANNPENITPLDKESNADSGRSLWEQLANLVRVIGESPQVRSNSSLKEITLNFQRVEVTQGKSRSTAPPKPGALSCAEVAELVTDKASTSEQPLPLAPDRSEYPIKAGGAATTLEALKEVPSTTELNVTRGRNRAANQLIPGLRLTQLMRKPGSGKDTIDAMIDGRTKTRLPITLVGFKSSKGADIVFKVLPPDNKLQIHPKYLTDELRFTYPHLSEGSVQLKQDEQGDVTGKGTLIPSEPLMNKKPVDVSVDFGTAEFHGAKSFTAKELAKPFLIARVTNSSLSVDLGPSLQAQGRVDFAVGPADKPWLDGFVAASADETRGFTASGGLNAHLPGVKSAEGTIEYAGHTWKGQVDIASEQIGLPDVKEGSLHLSLDGTKGATPIEASGSIVLQPPGFEPITLSARREKDQWIYHGAGSLKVPGLDKPVKIAVTHDGSTLSGTGHVEVTRGGLSGKLTVGYNNKTGVSGSGELSLKKEKLDASIKAKLGEDGKLSGKGDLTYRFAPNMEGTASVEWTENHLLKLLGGITIPKPIRLFGALSNSYVIFSRHVDIPIAGLSVGSFSVGLIARIGGELGADYSIGPGLLKNVSATASGQINLADPSKYSFSGVSLKGTLDIPASAGLSLSVRGGVGVSAGIGSITGGISATGRARLEGGLAAPASVQYAQNRFILDVTPTIKAGLVLSLGLSADVTAEALGYEKKWVWQLANYAWNSGLVFGMTAPIHYDSASAFKLPSPNQIQWIVPDINVHQLVSSLINRVKG